MSSQSPSDPGYAAATDAADAATAARTAVAADATAAGYSGTADYIAAPELMQTVNVAMTLSRPLLIKGEPGTGKTMLAQSIARGLDMPLIAWNIKSTTKAQDGLYVYDTVQRLYDGQFGDGDVSRHRPLHQARQAGRGLHARRGAACC